MNDYPYLRRDTVFLARRDSVEFRSSEHIKHYSRPADVHLMHLLSTRLDGCTTLGELLETLEAADRIPAARLIDWLIAEQFVHMSKVSRAAAPLASTSRGSIAAYLEHMNIDATATFSLLDEAPVFVLGQGSLALATARSALALGMRVQAEQGAPWLDRLKQIVDVDLVQIVAAPDPEWKGKFSAVVLADDDDGSARAAQVATVASEAGCAFIYAGLYRGMGIVGPFVAPACRTEYATWFVQLNNILDSSDCPVATWASELQNAMHAGPLFCGLVGQQAALTVFGRTVGLPRERDGYTACVFDSATLQPAVVYLD